MGKGREREGESLLFSLVCGRGGRKKKDFRIVMEGLSRLPDTGGGGRRKNSVYAEGYKIDY